MFAAAGLAWPVHATQRTIPLTADLQANLDAAADGDSVVLQTGTHRGPVRINHKITLTGEKGAILAAQREGSVVTVLAAEAVVCGLTIKGSGTNFETMDSGV